MRFWTVFYCSVSLLVMLSPLTLGQFQPNSQNIYPAVTPAGNNFYSSPNNYPANNYNNQPGNFGNSRIPQYQPNRNNLNNPQFQSPRNQPRRFNSYNTPSPPQSVNNFNSRFAGPLKYLNDEIRKALTHNMQDIPEQQTYDSQRRVFRAPGTQRNNFGPRYRNRDTTIYKPYPNNQRQHFSNPQFTRGYHTGVVYTHPNQTSRPIPPKPITPKPTTAKPTTPKPTTPKPTPAPHSTDGDPMKGHRIVCLYNSKHYYRNLFTPALIDPNLCTHINYEFAILDPATYEMISGEPSLDIKEGFYEVTVNLRKINPNLKVLISLGGWEDSTEKYSIMAADENKRKNFVVKAVQFLTAHGFDGLDLAWEYPNCWKGAIDVRPADKPNFVKLLELLFNALKKLGLVFSISVGAVKREIEAAYDVKNIMNYVDYINVMTYDMHGAWEPKTGHHMQFDKVKGDEDPYCNVKAALQVWVDLGADKKMINMGIATYGKTYTLENPANHGLGAPAIGIGNSNVDQIEGGFVLYNTMCQWLNAGNWTEVEHRQVGFYAYSGDQWACYDPPMMMVRKAKYVMEEGLGGVLIKDLGGDDYMGKCFNMQYPLLKMCKLEMMQKIRKMYPVH